MTEKILPTWQKVWREGFAPSFSKEGLVGLAIALRDDDRRLMQGSTTTPPPLQCVEDWPCEAADAIATVGWVGNTLVTVGEVEEFFARACFEADQRLGEPAACRHFLNWYDDTPRNEMREVLLREITTNLLDRKLWETAARLHCPLVKETPLDIVADWLEDHERTDLSEPLRFYLKEISDVFNVDLQSPNRPATVDGHS